MARDCLDVLVCVSMFSSTVFVCNPVGVPVCVCSSFVFVLCSLWQLRALSSCIWRFLLWKGLLWWWCVCWRGLDCGLNLFLLVPAESLWVQHE